MKTRDKQGRVCCAECMAPRKTPHSPGCSSYNRTRSTRQKPRLTFVRLDENNKPIVAVVPAEQAAPSARWLHVFKTSRHQRRLTAVLAVKEKRAKLRRENKQRMRKQRLTAPGRVADLRRAA